MGKRVLVGKPVLQVPEQLGQLLGKVIRRGLSAIALQRKGRQRIGAGGPAECEVDAAGEQAGQQSCLASGASAGRQRPRPAARRSERLPALATLLRCR